jgi:dTDP-D-glucose 4,6-dehydratase
VIGTVNLLEALRGSDDVRAIVVVTSDKCYLNRGLEHAYTEDVSLGGADPYSSSKAAQELVAAAYRHSYDLPIARCTAAVGPTTTYPRRARPKRSASKSSLQDQPPRERGGLVGAFPDAARRRASIRACRDAGAVRRAR